jgi:hypothetical protein
MNTIQSQENNQLTDSSMMIYPDMLVGISKEFVTEELRQSFDLVIQLDSDRIDGKVVDENLDKQVINTTLELIHDYATVHGIEGVMTKEKYHESGIEKRIKLCDAMQGFLLTGINPIDEINGSDIDTVFNTQKFDFADTLTEKDKDIFISAMTLSAKGYAQANKSAYTDLESSSERDSQADNEFHDIFSKLGKEVKYTKPNKRSAVSKFIKKLFKQK